MTASPDDTLLIYAPVPLFRGPDGRLMLEKQAINGLQRWADNFDRLLVMAPRPGRIHKEYKLPFAELGVGADLREVKTHAEFGPRREEILSMIWDMEEEIMGRQESAA